MSSGQFCWTSKLESGVLHAQLYGITLKPRYLRGEVDGGGYSRSPRRSLRSLCSRSPGLGCSPSSSLAAPSFGISRSRSPQAT